jgi:hypothetical protein
VDGARKPVGVEIGYLHVVSHGKPHPACRHPSP